VKGSTKTSEKQWNARRVLAAQQGDRIKKVAAELAEAEAGNKAFIGHYQPAITQVFNTLSEAEITQLKETAKEWNETEVPKEVQQK
jgi:hypothetical protein